MPSNLHHHHLSYLLFSFLGFSVLLLSWTGQTLLAQEPATAASNTNDAKAAQDETSEQKVADWSQWRGPNRDGKIADLKWPDTLSSESLKEQWSVKLGPSYSGPIVAGKMVFVTETEDKKNEVVKAFNTETGEEVWRASWEGSMKVPFFAASNGSWIRATPAYSEGKLYVSGIKDVLVCLDAKDGSVIWKVDFPEKFKTPAPQFGAVCSPLIDGNDLYIQAGNSFVKLNKNTGELIWESLNDREGVNAMSSGSFSSPYIGELAGQRQILVQTRTTLHGVSLEDGRSLWSKDIPAFRGMNIVTPTVFNDGVFTSTYGGNSQMINVAYSGGAMTSRQGWTAPVQGYMSSPVIVGDHAYLHLKNQRFACFDMRTGEIAWRSKPYGKYASIVASGDKLMVLDERGDLMLIKANPEKFEVIDSRKVAKNSWAHLAVRGDQVFVRELNGLKVYQWKP